MSRLAPGRPMPRLRLVEYPSRRAFFEIATDPYVQEIGEHRTAGLEGQWLIAATERLSGPGVG